MMTLDMWVAKRGWMVGLAAAALLGASDARAQSDEGFFSAEGVQIRSDARLHTLFLVFNDRGYDDESDRGPLPLRAPRYSAVRAAARKKFQLKEDAVKLADPFVASHKDPVRRYVESALVLEDAPAFKLQEGRDNKGYEGITRLLITTWNGGAADQYDADNADIRKVGKDALARVDALTADLRKLLRLDGGVDEQFAAEAEDAPRLVVLLNPLDAHGTQYRVATPGIRHVVLGPVASIKEGTALDPVVVELATMLLHGELKKVGASDAAKALHKAAGPAAADLTPEAYVSEAVSRAVARKLLGRALVLRNGADPVAELPAEAALLAEWNAFSSGTDAVSAALPGMLQRASTGAAPSPAAAPGAAPSPVGTPAATTIAPAVPAPAAPAPAGSGAAKPAAVPPAKK